MSSWTREMREAELCCMVVCCNHAPSACLPSQTLAPTEREESLAPRMDDQHSNWNAALLNEPSV